MTETRKRILVVEDEAAVRRFLRHSLEANGFFVIEADCGELALQLLSDARADLVILDFGLPGISGLETLRRIRGWSSLPVIFLTARNLEQDKVDALDSGADDYLTKPFGVPELMARIRVALRKAPVGEESAPIYRTGPLEIDRSAHLVKVAGRVVKLTATEYDLLVLLAKHGGKVVPHRTILREVWGPNSVEHHHYLRVYFGHLRKKLDAAEDGASRLIETELGVGYRLGRED